MFKKSISAKNMQNASRVLAVYMSAKFERCCWIVGVKTKSYDQ